MPFVKETDYKQSFRKKHTYYIVNKHSKDLKIKEMPSQEHHL